MVGLTKEQERLLAQLGELVADCIRIGVEQERERCAAEIRRIQKRNTNTSSIERDVEVWNRAVKTLADECADAIASP